MKKIAFILSGIGIIFLLASGPVLAQNFVNETGTNTTGSREFGFDPTNLMNAVTGAVDSDKCFICVNTTSEAGGSTAGALTNSMFGEIRRNNDADLGKQSTRPEDQDPSIPREAACGSNCNDSGAFSFSIPVPVMNFLSTGEAVSPTNPAVSETVGKKGVKMEFTNNFVFNADGSSTFDQTMKQTTFTGGADFLNSPPGSGNEVQIVEFSARSENAASARLGSGIPGTIFWSQSIKEGGFDLVTDGFVLYNSGNFPKASAPTGQGQSTGGNNQEIGGGGGR